MCEFMEIYNRLYSIVPYNYLHGYLIPTDYPETKISVCYTEIIHKTMHNVAGNEPNWPTHLARPKNFFTPAYMNQLFVKRKNFLHLPKNKQYLKLI